MTESSTTEANTTESSTTEAAAARAASFQPSGDQTRAVVGAILAATAPDDGPLRTQILVLKAISQALTHTDIDPTVCTHVTPEELVDALGGRDAIDPQFADRVMRFMALSGLLRDPIPDEVIAAGDAYAAALGHETWTETIAPLEAHHVHATVTDFARYGYSEDFLDKGRQKVLHTSKDNLGDGWNVVDNDEDLARRWESLADCPDGSLGQAVYDFYCSRNFVVPGRPDSAPPLLAQHDWVHVLADYGTSVECEIEVFSFLAESDDEPQGVSLLAMIIGLFATGSVSTAAGIFEADTGHLEDPNMATRMADALRRGEQATMPDGSRDGGLLAVDWFDHADRSIDEVRRACNIPPKSKVAVAAGSPATFSWDGLSTYQQAHCDTSSFDKHPPFAPSVRS